MPNKPIDLVTITLRPEGPGPPAAVRLKRCLKSLLRAYGLRCVDIREVVSQPVQAPDQNPKQSCEGESRA
jgi:hypothetical protein